MIIQTIEGVNYPINGSNPYNQVFKDFCVLGKNNSGIVSIGIDISSVDPKDLAHPVNYSLVGAQFENVQIQSFDTALNIKECCNSNFKSISIYSCRLGINIVGKAVNLTFTTLKATNFTNSNTSSISRTVGLNIDSFFYSAAFEGRPEGIIIGDGCLIFGAANNIIINRCLFFRISNSIIDGATDDCIVIGGPDNISIKGCYIYTNGKDSSGIKLNPINVSQSKILIADNEIVGYQGELAIGKIANNFGVNSVVKRIGVTFENNYITNFKNPIFFNYLNGSKITSNYGRTNYGPFIYLQSDCSDTIVDGNISDDSLPILALHPTTSSNLKIGTNTSLKTKTSFRGYALMLKDQSQVTTSNEMYNSELYYRVMTIPISNKQLGGLWVENQTAWSESKICSQLPATVDTKIYYEAIAIPHSATV